VNFLTKINSKKLCSTRWWPWHAFLVCCPDWNAFTHLCCLQQSTGRTEQTSTGAQASHSWALLDLKEKLLLRMGAVRKKEGNYAGSVHQSLPPSSMCILPNQLLVHAKRRLSNIIINTHHLMPVSGQACNHPVQPFWFFVFGSGRVLRCSYQVASLTLCGERFACPKFLLA